MSKPRIIAGTAKGRLIEVPKFSTRPSPARLREALFNILGFYQKGSFLDLFSGSGAIGLEAASRGWQVTCVEISKAATNIIFNNANALNLNVSVIQADALQFITKYAQVFDVVFAAPPYNLDLETIFQQIINSDVAKGVYVLQYPSQLNFTLQKTKCLKKRNYGSNALSLMLPTTNPVNQALLSTATF